MLDRGSNKYVNILLFVLCHSGANLNESRPRATTWHVDTQLLDGEMCPVNHLTKSASLHEGLYLVASAAKRVWEELYVCKKPVSIIWFIHFNISVNFLFHTSTASANFEYLLYSFSY